MDIKVKRIAPKLKDLYNEKIDISDIKSNPDAAFLSRSLAALVIQLESGIDSDAASSCVTDGFNDLGLDAIFYDETQKRLILVQTKWRTDGCGSIKQEEMNAFLEGVKRVINNDLAGANDKILSKKMDIEAAISDMNFQIYLIFCHTGNEKANDFVLRPLKSLMQQTNDENNELLIYKEYNCTDIYNYLANGLTSDFITLDDVVLNNWGSITEPHKVYYGTIKATQIGEWFKKHSNKLFDKNIRFYKGNTEVNSGIKTTLMETPEDFFYFNNGIKLLCKRITRKLINSTDNVTGIFTLEGVSLVNGAQTTGSIGSVYDENPDQLDKAHVFIQLIDLENVDDIYLNKITKNSNTQNKVGSTDFVSLDPVQEQIKKELSLLNIAYSYKGGVSTDITLNAITLDEAIVAQACSLEEISNTAYAKGNIGRFTEDITKAPYKTLFNPSTNVVSLANFVYIFRETEKTLKERQNQFYARKKLTLVHGNRFILHSVIKSIKTTTDLFTDIVSIESIRVKVLEACDSIIPKLQQLIETKFLDSYPAYIFKNVAKCKILEDSINEHPPQP